MEQVNGKARSDSSMDDCNDLIVKVHKDIGPVQIPLWTIVTIIFLRGDARLSEFRFLYGRL